MDRRINNIKMTDYLDNEAESDVSVKVSCGCVVVVVVLVHEKDSAEKWLYLTTSILLTGTIDRNISESIISTQNSENEDLEPHERRKLKKLRAMSDSEDEEDDDDDEQLKDLIDDAPIEEDGSDEADTDDDDDRAHGQEKRKKKSSDDEQLEDDDYEMLEENLGVKIKRTKRFKRLRRNEDSDGEPELDESMERDTIANQLFDGDRDDVSVWCFLCVVRACFNSNMLV